MPRGCSLRSGLRAGAPQSKAQQTLAVRGGQGFASPRQGQLRGCWAPGGLPAPRGSGGSAAGRSEGEAGVRDPPALPRTPGVAEPVGTGSPGPSGAFLGRIRWFLRPFPWSTERRVSPTGCRRGPAAWTGRGDVAPRHLPQPLL